MTLAQVPAPGKGVMRPAPRYEMVPTCITADYWTVTSESDRWGCYDVTRDGPDAPWTCECPSFTRGHRICKHARLVEERTKPALAPAPATSGSVMDVLRQRREANEARREERALPFRPTPMPARPRCQSCKTRDAIRLYDLRYCELCGFQELF